MRDVMAPPKFVGIEHDTEHVIVTSRGDLRAAPMIYLDEDTTGRIRDGYMCARCFEPHPSPYPKACSVCKFPMAERQAEFFAKNYKGTVRVGQGTTLEEEQAFMSEWEEIQRRKRRDEILRPTQVLLPGKDF